MGSVERWTVVLTCVAEKEGDQFVSYCEELGTSSCGDTIEEAFENIEEAVEVHLDALEEVGELGRVFRERAIEVHQLPLSEPIPRVIPMGKLVKAIQRQIPANPALAV